jgi:hypothetical protein
LNKKRTLPPKATLNNSGEVVERLAPKPSVLRELYLKSGNFCAFKDCNQVMVDHEGDFVGEVCHIEAAEAGGQRFNPDNTNEQNREISNLMLLCATHHKKTNNVRKFTVDVLRNMKAEHEGRFLNLEEKLGSMFKDSTDSTISIPAQNLNRINRVLSFDCDNVQLSEMIGELSDYIKKLENVPVQIREFLATIATRMYKMRNTGAVSQSMGTYMISTDDLETALCMSKSQLTRHCRQLEQYGLARIDETGDFEMPHAVFIYRAGEWSLWMDLIEFSKRASIDLTEFWRDLDFSALDE